MNILYTILNINVTGNDDGKRIFHIYRKDNN